MDAADDAAVFRALFAEAEAWLHAKGAQIARGPFSHSINEESGLLIDGFEHPPMMMMPYHPPYAKGHVEACGYRKAKDLEAWDRKLKDRRPMRKPDLSGAGVRLRNLNPKDYRGDIERVMAVFNDAWAGNWGFVPFTADEIAHLAQSLRPILSPDLMVIAEQDDTPVAMVIVTPNIAEAVADLDGKLWPLGWAKLLYRLKAGQISSARMPLMGVRRSLQNTLLGAEIVRAMIATVVEAIDARVFERVELSWILEDNAPMQALLKVMRATRYKTYRVFEKSLSAPH
ncbi:MAG: dATP pyrophosphohydrolase [Maricaulaceae bacterium]